LLRRADDAAAAALPLSSSQHCRLGLCSASAPLLAWRHATKTAAVCLGAADDAATAVAMAGALCATLRALPAALRPHARALERYALCALVAPRSPPRLRLAAAELLALVPRAAGAPSRPRAACAPPRSASG